MKKSSMICCGKEKRILQKWQKWRNQQRKKILNNRRVFFIGPFMIYVSSKAKGLNNLERFTLYGLGVATIYYNGKNYLESKN